MLDYTELYDYLRKEKYSDQLQQLPKNFIPDLAEFLHEKKTSVMADNDMFSEDLVKAKKQFENTISIFRELLRIRKRKILNLVFVASETGIMKRDFGTMLQFEQDLFERLVLAVDDADKQLQQLLSGTSSAVSGHKMVIVAQPITEFVDMSGGVVGPFEKGALVNLDTKIADILIADGKAVIVDEPSGG